MPTYHEEGRYRGKVLKANLDTAKNLNQTPQIVLDVQLLGLYGKDGQLYECEQSRFPPRVYLSLTEQTMGTDKSPGWVRQTLEYLGLDGDLNEVPGLKNWEGDFWCHYEVAKAGKHVGETFEKWNVNRGNTYTATPPEESLVRKLNTLFFGNKKSTKPKPAAPLPQQQPLSTTPALVTAGPQAEDPIPF